MSIGKKTIAAASLATAALGLSVTTAVGAQAAPNLVGPGCADYAALHPDGPASVAGMSQDPVTVAASNNPELSTLTQAVSGQLNPGVNLVDTLNGGQFTVFAPTDAAFAKLPVEKVDQLKTDAPLLKKILTYHVVPGQISPNRIDGIHPTVQGATLNVTGPGNALRVNNASSVVCGGVPTLASTVYMVDTLLMPPA